MSFFYSSLNSYLFIGIVNSLLNLLKSITSNNTRWGLARHSLPERGMAVQNKKESRIKITVVR